MGSEVSKDRGCLREEIGDELILETTRDDDLNISQTPKNIQKYRLVGLMQGLQRVARLQEQLTNTQIDFRQKRREAAFKRDLVWDSDAKFMRELQKLIAEGSESLRRDFKRLERLADECQAARDVLGPMEQEGIEAEQRWEGQIWSLRQAENNVYQEFNAEFRIAESYPSAPPSIDSSQYESSEFESESSKDDLPSSQGNAIVAVLPKASLKPHTIDIEPPPTSLRSTTPEPALLGVETRQSEIKLLETNSTKWETDSGIEDIDRSCHRTTMEGLIGPPQRLPSRKYASELYAPLHTDFGTKRDRINKWLESSALASRIEATSIFTVLRDKMSAESMQMPSNWAQLVIAYWELDGAVTPNHCLPVPDIPPTRDPDPHSSVET